MNRLRISLALGLLGTIMLSSLALAEAEIAGNDDERIVVRRTTLVVADIEKSIAFYRDVLGYTRWYYSAGTVSEGGLPSAARTGDPNVFAIMKGRHPWIGMVGLLQKGHAQPVDVDAAGFRISPGDTILMLETDDLDGIYSRMQAAGTPIWKHPETTTVTGAGGRQWDATFLFAFDPDGHLLEINQPASNARAASSTVRRAFADTRFGQLHYRYTDANDGTPLIMFHQTPLSGRMFTGVMTELGEQSVFAPDTPGYGESARPAALPAIGDYADAMVDWLDAENLRQIDVFGYHTGSAIALDLAVRYPERVRSVVLMSVPLFDPEETSRWRDPPDDLPTDGSHLVDMWNSTYTHRAPGQTLEMVATTVAEKQRAGIYEGWALAALSTYDVGSAMADISQPLLIINPGDGLFERTKRAAELAANARYIERPEWAYGIFDTEAPSIAALLESFLQNPRGD